MKISKTSSPVNIKIDRHYRGETILVVLELKYLGSIFTENGSLDREIEARCQKANAVTYHLLTALLQDR